MVVLLIITTFIVAGVVGFGVGRASKKTFTPKEAEELEEMREEARESVNRRTEKRKAKILSFAKKEGRITSSEVEDMFCISGRTSRRYLNELEDEGKINQIGESGRGVHYVPIS